MFRLARAAWRAAPAVAGTLGVIGAGVGASSVAHADALNKGEWRQFTLVNKRQVSPNTAEYTVTFPPGHEFDRLGLEPASLVLARANVGGACAGHVLVPCAVSAPGAGSRAGLWRAPMPWRWPWPRCGLAVAVAVRGGTARRLPVFAVMPVN